MIYVPDYNQNKCAIIRDKDTIRVYDTTPTYNSTVSYTDYFINSNYLSLRGSTQFNQYSSLPTCLDNSKITQNVFYRCDIDRILIIFLVLVLFCFYFPYRIISRMFGRWFKI